MDRKLAHMSPIYDAVYDVFIAYTGPQRAIAEHIFNHLTTSGLRVYADHHDDELSDEFSEIGSRLQVSRILVLVLPPPRDATSPSNAIEPQDGYYAIEELHMSLRLSRLRSPPWPGIIVVHAEGATIPYGVHRKRKILWKHLSPHESLRNLTVAVTGVLSSLTKAAVEIPHPDPWPAGEVLEDAGRIVFGTNYAAMLEFLEHARIEVADLKPGLDFGGIIRSIDHDSRTKVAIALCLYMVPALASDAPSTLAVTTRWSRIFTATCALVSVAVQNRFTLGLITRQHGISAPPQIVTWVPWIRLWLRGILCDRHGVNRTFKILADHVLASENLHGAAVRNKLSALLNSLGDLWSAILLRRARGVDALSSRVLLPSIRHLSDHDGHIRRLDIDPTHIEVLSHIVPLSELMSEESLYSIVAIAIHDSDQDAGSLRLLRRFRGLARLIAIAHVIRQVSLSESHRVSGATIRQLTTRVDDATHVAWRGIPGWVALVLLSIYVVWTQLFGTTAGSAAVIWGIPAVFASIVALLGVAVGTASLPEVANKLSEWWHVQENRNPLIEKKAPVVSRQVDVEFNAKLGDINLEENLKPGGRNADGPPSDPSLPNGFADMEIPGRKGEGRVGKTTRARLSNSGWLIAVTGGDCTVTLYDLRVNKRVGTYFLHANDHHYCSAEAFFDEHERYLYTSLDYSVFLDMRLLENPAKTLKVLKRAGAEDGSGDELQSPSGRYLSMLGPDSVVIADLNTGKRVGKWYRDDVRVGRVYAVTNNARSVFDYRTCIEYRTSGDSTWCYKFSPYRTVVWDANTGKRREWNGRPPDTNRSSLWIEIPVVGQPQEGHIARVAEASLEVISVDDGHPVRSMKVQPVTGRVVDVAPSGRYLFRAEGPPYFSGKFPESWTGNYKVVRTDLRTGDERVLYHAARFCRERAGRTIPISVAGSDSGGAVLAVLSDDSRLSVCPLDPRLFQ